MSYPDQATSSPSPNKDLEIALLRERVEFLEWAIQTGGAAARAIAMTIRTIRGESDVGWASYLGRLKKKGALTNDPYTLELAKAMFERGYIEGAAEAFRKVEAEASKVDAEAIGKALNIASMAPMDSTGKNPVLLGRMQLLAYLAVFAKAWQAWQAYTPDCILVSVAVDSRIVEPGCEMPNTFDCEEPVSVTYAELINFPMQAIAATSYRGRGRR